MANKKYTKEQIQQMVVESANKYGVDPRLALAIAQQESGFDPNARSKVGAMGVMQLMPNTAKGLDVKNPYDPRQNIDGGMRMVAGLNKKYKGNTSLILAAYNAGSGAVQKYKGVPPFPETQKYVNSITSMIKNPNSTINLIAKFFSPLSNPIQRAQAEAGLIKKGFKYTRSVVDRLLEADTKKRQQQQAQQQGMKGTPTGEAAPTIPQDMSNVNTPDLSGSPQVGEIPQVNSPSGIPTNKLAQMALNPSIAKEVIPYQDFKNPAAIAKMDELTKQYGITPEQIQQIQQPTQDALLRQEQYQKDINQGMVDRMRTLQSQYDQIIGSDPRLQNQGYYLDPAAVQRDINARDWRSAFHGNYDNISTPQQNAQALYEAQFANKYGVPYQDYIAAKTAQINNQLGALKEYQALQGNVNTAIQNNYNNFLDALTTYQKNGIEGLTDAQKNILDFYAKPMQQWISSQAALQGNVNTNATDLAKANQQAATDVYKTDVQAQTGLTGDILDRRNTIDRINYGNSSGSTVDRFSQASKYGTAVLDMKAAGYSDDQIRSVMGGFGINTPPANNTQYQPSGLNFGFINNGDQE